jgi:nicotinate dehydrogenase subunit B
VSTGGPASSLGLSPRLSRWLDLAEAGVVRVRSGKVELGQGVPTALSQVVAEELDVDPSRVRMLPLTTGISPDEGYTAGSWSMEHSGYALRVVCANVRALLLARAAQSLGADTAALTVLDGTVTGPDGASATWWELADAALLDRDVDLEVPVKDVHAYSVVGRSLPRLDVPDKVAGRPRFLQDQRPPGVLHARVLRPPSRCAVLTSVDRGPASACPGVVAVHCDGSFLGVVAEREEQALHALEVLRRSATWDQRDSLPAETELAAFLQNAPAERVVAHAAQGHDRDRALPIRSVRLRCTRPFLAHASLAPSSALAHWDEATSRLEVWTHSQGAYALRDELARTLGLEIDDVVVQHVEGAGCYGHNAADDVALDAVLLARSVPGRPVLVVWSRGDELTWSPFGPAMVVEIEADLDVEGNVQAWRHEVWSNGHVGRPGSRGMPPLLAATHRAAPRSEVPTNDPPVPLGGGGSRNAVPLYDLPGQTVHAHRLEAMPLRTSALRALGAHLNVYAIEAAMDELAAVGGKDPIAYRLALLSDQRARAVLEAVAERTGWPGPPRAEGVGWGVGFAQYKNHGGYCAVVAEVEAEAELRVRRLTLAVDVGLVVSPDGVRNQVEGGALQSLSFTTKEQVRFDRRKVTSQTWEEYPILRFSEVPVVDVLLLDRPDCLSVGCGEVAMGPVAAAIGNAVRDALGVRVLDLPVSAANIVRAIETAGE